MENIGIFLVINQNFLYQIFPLATAKVAPATVSLIFYLSIVSLMCLTIYK